MARPDAAEQRRKSIRGTSDLELRWAPKLDPNLEQWRILGVEWLKTVQASKDHAVKAMVKFLANYIHGQNLTTVPAEFFRRGYAAPCFYETCLSHLSSNHQINVEFGFIRSFMAWVLDNHFSIEDDEGNRIVPPEYCDPIPCLPDEATGKAGGLSESNKNVLPWRYLKELSDILCPESAVSFKDWNWAQEVMDTRVGGDWFIVSPDLIDENDPDCVWRKRRASDRERKTYGCDEVVEMWSPVRAMGLFTKLKLPLRSFQVRMLDSGEADTLRYQGSQKIADPAQPSGWRYEMGSVAENTGALTQGSAKRPVRRGVFRQMHDTLSGRNLIGLFINTNKTADRGKEDWAKGYEVPWEHRELIYWLERLRNWQEKYNPIPAPIPWTSLGLKHLGQIKDISQLKQMGETCFLFRDATAEGDDRYKPIADAGPLGQIWGKLLKELEDRCERRHEQAENGAKLIFVKPDTQCTTYYPLHSLRVSLITAYATEGGVPMPILSKCIAGHARLVMTLYYTKMGITYVTDQMNEAEKRLMEGEQAEYMRWLKDKTLEQIKPCGAYNDPAALQAVLEAQSTGVQLLRDDKGICPKGGMGCDSGGVYINEDTGTVTYGAVPGYPQKNCVQCRWFFTGPAFLPGLVDHFNFIGAQIGDVGQRIIEFENHINELEEQRRLCEAQGQPYLNLPELAKFEKLEQAEIEKNDKLANDYNATLRLIMRCRAIANQTEPADGLQLVAVGGRQDVEIIVTECDRLQQILTVAANAVIFPENDARMQVLEAGNALDLMLALNGKPPICFGLSGKEMAMVIHQLTRLLQAQVGSIKDTIPIIKGERLLAEVGLEHQVTQLLEDMAGNYIQLADLQQVTGLQARPIRKLKGS